MTADAPFLLKDAHDRARNDINRWRGHCIDLFARLEQALGDTIDAIIENGKDSAVTRQAMFGKRVAVVRAAVASDRPLGDVGKSLVKAFDRIDPHLPLRIILTHASGRVLIGGDGRWEWHYGFTPSGKTAIRQEGHVTQDSAEVVERELAADVNRLRDLLRNLREQLHKG